MSAGASPLGVLAVAWLVWFMVHSLTASLTMKRLVDRMPRLAGGYRLAYNAVALVTLAAPAVALQRARGIVLFDPPNAIGWLLDGIAIVALLGFFVSLRGYDLRRFAGLGADSTAVSDGARLHLSGLNRFVRHPWYSLALVLIWTRPMDAAWLMSAGLLSGYLLIGAWLEERKLLLEFGSAYARYRERVPMFVPWPGRVLAADEARRLEAAGPRAS